MNTQEISSEVTHLLAQLPENKAREALNLFAQAVREAVVDIQLQSYYSMLLARKQEQELSQDLTLIIAHGGAFDWLHDEPDLYSAEDAMEKY